MADAPKPSRILVVGAEPIGKMIAGRLQDAGYAAEAAETLDATFPRLRRNPPDIAVVSSTIAGHVGAWLTGQVRAFNPKAQVFLWSIGHPKNVPDGVTVIPNRGDIGVVLHAVKMAAKAVREKS